MVACLVASTVALAGKPGKVSGPIRLKVPVLVAGADAKLSAPDLQATINGAPAKVLSMAGPSQDLILLVVLDLAGDLTLAQSATSAFLGGLDQLPQNVHVGLLRAQDSLRVLEDPTRDRGRIRKAVEELPVTGRAGLLSSVETVAQIASAMMARSPVRVAILYLTDSEVTNYREDFTNPVINSSDAGDLSRRFPEALIQEKIAKMGANLAATAAPVFVVHTTWRNDRLNTAYLDGLQQLAGATGGTAAVCRSLAEVPVAVQDAVQSALGMYVVTLESPRTGGKSAEVRLELTEDAASVRPVKFTYRSRFSLKAKE
jgi:hypothetical protein